MSAYHVIVQNPIYGFELDGQLWRLEEHTICEDGSRSVRISTYARHQGWDEPDWTFYYDPLTHKWDCSRCLTTYDVWKQFEQPEKLLQSLVDFFNINHPPVMKIHQA